MPTSLPQTGHQQKVQPPNRVPTLSGERPARFGSRKPSHTPKSAPNALQLRNPGLPTGRKPPPDRWIRAKQAERGGMEARSLRGRVAGWVFLTPGRKWRPEVGALGAV